MRSFSPFAMRTRGSYSARPVLPFALLAWMTVLALGLRTNPAKAYTIGSGFGAGCHEQITADAFEPFLIAFNTSGDILLPEDDGWQRVGAFLARQVEVDPAELSPSEYYLLTSLLVGVRSPDTEGHSVLNLENARALHTDPNAEGQYAHALRAIEDDGAGADANAVLGIRSVLRRELEEAVALSAAPTAERSREVSIYFDFYGTVEIDVWGPAYHLGRAAHAMQDSFSHTARDEADGFHSILSVLNYAEAVADTLVEERDGISHSDSYDRCGPDTAPVVAAATDATGDLFAAFRDLISRRAPESVDFVLDGWMTYRAGCTAEDDFCGNGEWLDIIREEPTGPYLCSVHWGGRPFGSRWAEVWMRAWIAFAVWRFWCRRRRRTLRRRHS